MHLGKKYLQKSLIFESIIEKIQDLKLYKLAIGLLWFFLIWTISLSFNSNNHSKIKSFYDNFLNLSSHTIV